MSEIEYKQCMSPYEHEERADLFMDEARRLAERHPEVIVNMENNTVARLDGTARTIANIAKHSTPQTLAPMYRIVHDAEAESAKRNKVLVEIASSRRIFIRRFEHRLGLIAKRYSGVKEKGAWNFIKDAGEGCLDVNFRYSLPLFYVFEA
ncbi:MAG TPA: hypothetical protein VJ227_01825 [Patescibacteria group bacterium]|nr:hypothetical protein [Patescibacteria group bacterium]